jgi:hypothetical protein
MVGPPPLAGAITTGSGGGPGSHAPESQFETTSGIRFGKNTGSSASANGSSVGANGGSGGTRP